MEMILLIGAFGRLNLRGLLLGGVTPHLRPNLSYRGKSWRRVRTAHHHVNFSEQFPLFLWDNRNHEKISVAGLFAHLVRSAHPTKNYKKLQGS